MIVFPLALHRLPRELFPVTIRLISRLGHELWSATIDAPDGNQLKAVRVPGFAGTEHVPVRSRIEFGDGTAIEETPTEGEYVETGRSD